MHIEQIVDRLLESGDASIQYRIKREILGISPDTSTMHALQAQIARKRKVVEVVSWPKEAQGGEGWIGTELHGVTGFDCGTLILVERGLGKRHPYLSQAKDALIRRGDDYKDVPPGYSVLYAIDRAGRGGLRTMRAWLLGLLGAEQETIVAEETAAALVHFRGLLQLESWDDISTPYTGSNQRYADCRIYKPQAKFPGGWHLPLLAATKQWRSEEALTLLADAFNHAVDLFPIPLLILKKGAHYVGPGNLPWQCLHWDDIHQISEQQDFATWLGLVTQLGQIGVVPKVPLFQKQAQQLYKLIKDEQWIASFKPSYVFKYMFGLEEDWRSRRRRENDIYFRFLITLHYCGLVHVEEM